MCVHEDSGRAVADTLLTSLSLSLSLSLLWFSRVNTEWLLSQTLPCVVETENSPPLSTSKISLNSLGGVQSELHGAPVFLHTHTHTHCAVSPVFTRKHSVCSYSGVITSGAVCGIIRWIHHRGFTDGFTWQTVLTEAEEIKRQPHIICRDHRRDHCADQTLEAGSWKIIQFHNTVQKMIA